MDWNELAAEFARDVLGISLTKDQEAFAEDIMDKIHNGEPVRIIIGRHEGEKELALRLLQKLAGKYVDDGDGVRASIALREAKRLTAPPPPRGRMCCSDGVY